MSYKKLMEGKKNETGVEAIDRYKQFLQAFLLENETFQEEIYLYQLEYFGLVSNAEESIQEKEALFKIQFPATYKRFMKETGSYKVYFKDFNELLVPHQLMTLKEAILSTDYFPNLEALTKDFGEHTARLDELIAFKHRDDYAFDCFDITTYSHETKEMDIYINDQDDWLGFKSSDVSFDHYISNDIDEEIDSIIHNF